MTSQGCAEGRKKLKDRPEDLSTDRTTNYDNYYVG